MKDAKRQLAAIMFTDIVGYSSLSHSNESLALELLAEHRELTRPILQRHSGVEIKTIGDAFLVKFESATDAVQCAIELQSRHQDRNFEAPSRKLELRIGIHLGDILLTEGDVYGDGVNIAARLQYLAKPGGICISGPVYDQIQNKIERKITYLKKKKLKNIAEPMRTYAVSVDRPRESAGESRIALSFDLGSWFRPAPLAGLAALIAVLGAGTFTWRHFGKTGSASSDQNNRVAVLPFKNISRSASDEYLSEGMTEELISSLSRIDRLRVLAKATVNQYQAFNKPISQIGTDLKVGTVVEGSVRRSDDRVRISVQLIDVASQENLWSQEFEGKIQEIFDIQKKMAGSIASQFRGREVASVFPPRSEQPQAAPTVTGQAYIELLKGRYWLSRRTEEGLARGIERLESAIRLDPAYAPSYAALANAEGLRAYYGLSRPKESYKKVLELTSKALAIDPNLTEALMSLAEVQAYYQYDWTSAEKTFKRAIESNPGQPTAHQWYAEFLAHLGRIDEAEQESALALQLDPLSLVANTASGVVAYLSGRDEQAVGHYLKTIEMDPGFMLPYYWLGRAYLKQGKYVESVKALEKAVDLSHGAPMMRAALVSAYAKAGAGKKARDALRALLAEKETRYISSYDFAMAYAGLGDTEKALAALENAISERAPLAGTMATDPVFDPYRKNPKFQRTLARLKTLF